MIFTIAGTAVPGLGLIAAKRRLVGSVILGIFAATVLSLGIYALVDRQGLLGFALNPTVLRRVAVALIVIAIVWVGVVVASHLSLRGSASTGPAGDRRGPGRCARLRRGRADGGRRQLLLHHGQLGQHRLQEREEHQERHPADAGRQADPKAGQTSKLDPWADKPRLNVLLLGGDSDRNRVGTRTDTVILASIDTKSGDTTLFSLPRNTGRMPFPSDSPLRKYYPNGFTNGDGNNAEYFLNAMYDNVPNTVPKDVLGATDNLGADALKLSVGEALGLQVDYYVLINLQGFAKMINALGGITVNINTYIPIGGNTDLGIPPKEYLKPGPKQKLDGREALWYARGRYGSDDFARMDRQRCVINAIIKQANPANMLARYEDIAKAGKTIVYTDMPQEVLPLMVDLSLRVKDGNVRSIVFKHGVDGFLSPNPNFSQMRKRVKIALGEAKSDKPEEEEDPSGSSTTESEDVNDSCAYDAKMAATAQPYR